MVGASKGFGFVAGSVDFLETTPQQLKETWGPEERMCAEPTVMANELMKWYCNRSTHSHVAVAFSVVLREKAEDSVSFRVDATCPSPPAG